MSHILTPPRKQLHEVWTDRQLALLRRISGAQTNGDLAGVWSNLAAAPIKQQRGVLQDACDNWAARLGLPSPIITPAILNM
eukprot:5458037-Ditylum_brightwellii.AAC.1